MAFIRKKPAEEKEKNSGIQNLIAPDELLSFAKEKNIKTSPLDVSALTKLLGITMRMEPMLGEESGCLKKDKSGTWIMTVNSLHHPHRQRFTIAHEIGHFIKHAMITEVFTDSVFFRNGQTDRMEVEANKFAAELLMPDSDFRYYIENNSQKVSDIAAHFEVSSMAVRIRAQQLGYDGHNL
ncbi:ImmA/IrrE family metallo-endopeptidase [Yersinia ruckeri]|uniref:ImmA/IrrE family metallo-endopeptidase n=1 Tax=Yersinia ruckeri TaxID=29486 RepID=UPI0005364D3E|nr:ImmA/IrrE family metallo-endopeptidase [Yersinia ruckeri]AUQ42798.1 ImmA/IrrE family metallo-endopeptidase [Yersinia ruckeri]EKN3361009.1 ImmA/IrrE family metallo-endopeptidase [Yersinia ruckeri]EKN4200806.1 ImmA/IrrE family metallo-endopeptidase [Yersinia ruckeri]EKN4725451.1 ImmA/IrrE family metallo-endopeptidase [Yersinia ruckeri]ELV7520339.1 ImmA/IrrE family metallo-endopeptidase [Yersinia ruckeri]